VVVRGIVHDRAVTLPDACRTALALAAVLGTEFELDVLAAGAGLDRPGALAALGPALASRLVEQRPDRPGWYRFRHPLVHEAIGDELATDRPALHAAAARAIEDVHAAALPAQAERLAAHWRQAAGADAPALALRYALLAAEQARAMLAWEESARLLELALSGRTGRARPELEFSLLLELGRSLLLAGAAGRALDPLLAAAGVARSLGDGRRLAEAALALGQHHSAAVSTAGSSATAAGLLEEALAALGDGEPVLRARLLGCLAGALVWTNPGRTGGGGRTRRDALSAEAVELATATGDDGLLARALLDRVHATWSAENAAERLALCDRLAALAGTGGHVPLAVQGLAADGRRARAVAQLELGDMASARAEARAYAAAADRLRQPLHQYWAAVLDGTVAMAEGRFAEAGAAAGRAIGFGNRLEARDPGEMNNGIASQLLVRLRELGRLTGSRGEELAEGLERSIAMGAIEFPGLPAWQAGRAVLQFAEGREDEARETFEELAAGGFTNVPGGAAWMATIAACAELCVLVGDRARAAELRPLLEPHAGRFVVVTFGNAVLGSAAHFLGLVCGMLGDVEAAGEHFEHALGANRRLGAPPLAARTAAEYAAVLLAAGRPGDAGRAAHLLAGAAATADRLGMQPLRRRIAAISD
jgi:tetratricopeptide (TPR) repeat protein